MDIVDLLHLRDIHVREPGQARRPLLRTLSGRLAARAGAPEETVLAALLNRESLGSTGIGHGIAVRRACGGSNPDRRGRRVPGCS